MPQKKDPEIRKHIATRIGELYDRLQVKPKEIASSIGVPPTHPYRWKYNNITPTAIDLYRLHDLARNGAWILPDFFGSTLEPYPGYALPRAATQFFNAPWLERLEGDSEIDTIGKEGSYNRYRREGRAAPFKFSEAMHALLEHFPPKEGRFKLDNVSDGVWTFSDRETGRARSDIVFTEDAGDDVRYYRSGGQAHRCGLDIPLTIRFDRSGFQSMRDQVQAAGLAIYPLTLDSVLVDQPEGGDVKQRIRDHLAERIEAFRERLNVPWRELSAACGVKDAGRWSEGETLPRVTRLYQLHHYARQEAGLYTDFFDVRLEPDPTYTTRKAVDFLKQHTFVVGEGSVAIEYPKMPVGIYEGLRELTTRFPAQAGKFELVGPEEESSYMRSGTRVDVMLRLDAQGRDAQLHAAESLNTLDWHAAGADRTPSTRVEDASHSIEHFHVNTKRIWTK